MGWQPDFLGCPGRNTMTLEETYKALKLQPLDDFIRLGLNRNHEEWVRRGGRYNPYARNDAYRQIGSTTYMNVSICMHLMKGRGSVAEVVAQDLRQVDRITNDIRQYMGVLGHNSQMSTRHGGGIVFEGNAGILYPRLRVNYSYNHNRVSRVFDDDLWKQRTIRRSQGPFAMVQTILYQDGRYQGLYDDMEPIFDFTEEGAIGYLKDHPGVTHEGFQLTTSYQKIPRSTTVDDTIIEDITSDLFGI